MPQQKCPQCNSINEIPSFRQGYKGKCQICHNKFEIDISILDGHGQELDIYWDNISDYEIQAGGSL